MYLNKQHARKRRELGKGDPVPDGAAAAPAHEEQLKGDAVQLEQVHDYRQEIDQDNGLHDVTDRMNEDFVYVY